MQQPNFKFHYPLSPQDPTEYVWVTNDSRPISKNFKIVEFFNPKNGLESHPIAAVLIEIAQYLRTLTNQPIRITSTYRNYVPPGGANPSAHQLGQAMDLQFIDTKVRDDFMIWFNAQMEEKAELYQFLKNAYGVTGIEVHDTFIHFDVAKTRLYEVFNRKRPSGFHYANKMTRLKGRRSTLDIKVENGVVQTEKAAPKTLIEAGSDKTRGVFYAIKNIFTSEAEDGLADWQGNTLLYKIFAMVLVLSIAIAIALAVIRIKG